MNLDNFHRHAGDQDCVVYATREGAPPLKFYVGKGEECVTYIRQNEEWLPNCHLSTLKEFVDFYDAYDTHDEHD